MNVIELSNIHYTYPGEIDVFKGLDFKLNKGQRVGIIGANGSGKTTLFSLIMGLTFPHQGQVSLFETACEKEDDFIQARKKIGYLFQDPDDQVFCPTVEEDIAFGPLNLGFKEQAVRNIITQVSEDLGIDHLQKRITTKLSWGQKRLVSLAGVLAMNPEVLILDEPTASIDDHVIRKLTDYLQSTEDSMLIASHDMKFLKDLAVDIYVLQDGRLTQHNSIH
jgi:cobalt/nickel transport system ATP-binding protein